MRWATVILEGQHRLGSDGVMPLDGRLSDANALSQASSAFDKRFVGQPMVVVLFRCARLSGEWSPVRYTTRNGHPHLMHKTVCQLIN